MFACVWVCACACSLSEWRNATIFLVFCLLLSDHLSASRCLLDCCWCVRDTSCVCLCVCEKERGFLIFLTCPCSNECVRQWTTVTFKKKGNKLFSFQFSCSLILPEDSLIWCFDNGDNISVQNLKSVWLIWDYLTAQTIPVISHNWSVGTLLRPRPPGFHSRTKEATFALQWPFHSPNGPKQCQHNAPVTRMLLNMCFLPPVVCMCIHCMSMSVCAFLCAGAPVWVVIFLQGLTPRVPSWLPYARLMNLNANLTHSKKAWKFDFLPCVHDCMCAWNGDREAGKLWPVLYPVRCLCVCTCQIRLYIYIIDLAVYRDWKAGTFL